MRLTPNQIITLKAIAERKPAADGFVYGPFGRSGHSLVRSRLLESRCGYQQGWAWGFRLTDAGRERLTRDERGE